MFVWCRRDDRQSVRLCLHIHTLSHHPYHPVKQSVRLCLHIYTLSHHPYHPVKTVCSLLSSRRGSFFVIRVEGGH